MYAQVTQVNVYVSDERGYVVGHYADGEFKEESPYFRTQLEARRALKAIKKNAGIPNRTPDMLSNTFNRRFWETINEHPLLPDEELPF